MTAVEDERTLPQVGAQFLRRAQLRALPNGAQIEGLRSGNVLTKVTDETFVVVALGASNVRSRVGETKQTTGLNAATYRYYRETDQPGAAGVAPDLLPGPVPDDVMDQSPITWGTVAQFKARFMTSIWGSAKRADIYDDTIDRAMSELGLAGDRDLSLGMPVNMYDDRLLNSLPVGATVWFGTPSRETGEYILYGKRANGRWGREDWHVLMGRMTAHVHHIGVLDHAEGIERKTWVDEVGTVDDLAAIHDFKRQAHAVGARARNNAGWCSEYQVSMRRAGIPDRVGRGRLRLLDPAAVSALDEGTVLRISESNTQVLYVRDNRSTNPCRTIRVAGTTTGHWFPHLSVASSDPLMIPVFSVEEMDTMPAGTVVRIHGGSDAHAWRKQATDTTRWQVLTGYEYVYNSVDLFSSGNDLVYSYIPRGSNA